MSNATQRDSVRASKDDTRAVPISSTFTLANLLEAQRTQWEAYNAWQQSLLTFGKDFWEQWAVRFAGGMPIDG